MTNGSRVGLGRRLASVAVGLVCLPLLVEAAALDPREVSLYREPFFAAVRLILVRSLPYLAAAVSSATLALLLRAGRAEEPVPVPRASIRFFAAGALLAFVAAFATPGLDEALLAGEVQTREGGVQLGRGGPLAPSVPIEPLPLEESGPLAERPLPAKGEPWTATVRWVGLRTALTTPPPSRIELLAGGTVRDVTDDFYSLGPGEAKVFTRAVRVGPGPARVRLRLAEDPVPPILFFDARRALDARGVAIDTGGGDSANQVSPRVGPGEPTVPSLDIRGEHVPGGFTVMVFSGEQWQRHDLSTLLARRGFLEVELRGVAQTEWSVRLVGDGVESALVPLSRFASATGADAIRYTLPLRTFRWDALLPTEVVGVAFLHEGPAGPFELRLVRARAVPPERPPSGFALATTTALDPDARPSEALLVAGTPRGEGPIWRYLFVLRLAVALLVLLGAVGASAAGRIVARRPLVVAVALLAGPIAAALLEPLMPALAVPRLEQVPIVLGLIAVGTAGLARREPRGLDVAGSREPLDLGQPGDRGWLDALVGVANLGIIALHVTSDPAGLPYPAAAPGQRLAPLVARAFATGLDYPILLLASFFLLARSLASKPRSYGEVVRARLRSLVPPFLLWSAAYLAIRHAKAVAFGYEEAYRRELASGASWLGYLLLGSAQYHLHYLPLLLGLTLLFPLFRPALRRPLLGLALIATLALWPFLDAALYQKVASPEVRDYGLRATKTFAYLGYGLFAFALSGSLARGIERWDRLLLMGAAAIVGACSLAVLQVDAREVAAAGQWLPLGRLTSLARDLLPAALFVLFQAGAGSRWPRPLQRLGRLGLGTYLVHPAILDLLEILERTSRLVPAASAALNFALVSLVTVLVVALIARVPALRWTVGLDRAES